MSDETGYNGWANYETWCMSLWFDNDEGNGRRLSTLSGSHLRVVVG